LLPRRSKGVEADNLDVRKSEGGDLAVVLTSIDLIGKEEGSCNLRRKSGPS
jgi:hypothetical protein